MATERVMGADRRECGSRPRPAQPLRAPGLGQRVRRAEQLPASARQEADPWPPGVRGPGEGRARTLAVFHPHPVVGDVAAVARVLHVVIWSNEKRCRSPRNLTWRPRISSVPTSTVHVLGRSAAAWAGTRRWRDVPHLPHRVVTDRSMARCNLCPHHSLPPRGAARRACAFAGGGITLRNMSNVTARFFFGYYYCGFPNGSPGIVARG
jgi:hypothetical protein